MIIFTASEQGPLGRGPGGLGWQLRVRGGKPAEVEVEEAGNTHTCTHTHGGAVWGLRDRQKSQTGGGPVGERQALAGWAPPLPGARLPVRAADPEMG